MAIKFNCDIDLTGHSIIGAAGGVGGGAGAGTGSGTGEVDPWNIPPKIHIRKYGSRYNDRTFIEVIHPLAKAEGYGVTIMSRCRRTSGSYIHSRYSNPNNEKIWRWEGNGSGEKSWWGNHLSAKDVWLDVSTGLPTVGDKSLVKPNCSGYIIDYSEIRRFAETYSWSSVYKRKFRIAIVRRIPNAPTNRQQYEYSAMSEPFMMRETANGFSVFLSNK